MERKLHYEQHVGKAEANFNIKLINYGSGVKETNSILAFKKFQAVRHNFNKRTKFIIIDKSVNVNWTKDLLRVRLKQRENFSIQKLETLAPLGRNQG